MGTRSYSYTYHRQVDATQVNSTWILNPTTVLTARYGTNRFPNLIAEVSQGFDLGSLGFPASYTSQLQAQFFPTTFPRNFSQLGQNTDSLDNWESQILNGALAKTVNNHNVTVGAEYRRIRMDFQDFSNALGTYGFSGAFTQAAPNVTGDGTGSDLADLLLGYPASGEVDLTTLLKTYLDYYALFAQDDWCITRPLTLNLGLRYESETGLKEDNNRLAAGFDRGATSRLSNGTVVTGGILFAGVGGNQRDVGDLSRLKFAPRLGASYQLTPKTVMRGGYGILYARLRYDPICSLAPGYRLLTHTSPASTTTRPPLDR
jgi:outer membrane receptor protein involved in Fe transport